MADGQHGGSVVSTVASQQEGPGFESKIARLTSRGSLVQCTAGVGPFCVEFARSP